MTLNTPPRLTAPDRASGALPNPEMTAPGMYPPPLREGVPRRSHGGAPETHYENPRIVLTAPGAVVTTRVLWWLRNRARPTGPAEGQQLLALIDELEAAVNT